ncbi:hypothetical protein [Saliphagus infecundisoli]|uniref:Uncharacterized protein n=1 Tax=Saliphagus infecundisoli TaxID=1849069 RepID=A0ABD5QBK7_9EURY|nr:hypothetical protein [Saliphagus infecundisoli]
MRVVDARVDWKEDVGNDPVLYVLADEISQLDEMRFERHEDGLWYAERDGLARYFSWSGPGNEGGFSGQCYAITTVDGEEVTLKGPWSSRAGVFNKRGFGPVVDVRLTTDPEGFERGRTFRGRSITLRQAKTAADIVGGCHLESEIRFNAEEPYWVVRGNGGGG